MGASEQLNGKRVVVALTGGIACYKACGVVSRLVQQGAEVTAMMTDAATKFVGPLTLESLSGRAVQTSLWQAVDNYTSEHVDLARWCDAMLIAPASANTIAKLAGGICDNVVTAVACALPTDTPLIVAPSMNEGMWLNPLTQRNVKTLVEVRGVRMIGPGEGWQACRTEGAGRMSEPDEIVEAMAEILGG
ncbi:MAG: flavoprotein [Planctomycetota bacterium]|jgi:phosphopantothenoylcysteine decarboxylase/phosphopantothenate--cysteine ligase